MLVWAVLDELFANAAQALTELGGGEIEVDVERDDTEVLVHIRDGGDGIQHGGPAQDLPGRGTQRTTATGASGSTTRGVSPRRVGGALELAEPRGRDVQLGGAHFLLNLPRQ